MRKDLAAIIADLGIDPDKRQALAEADARLEGLYLGKWGNEQILRAGEALLVADEVIPHGAWGRYVSSRFPRWGGSTIRSWMLVARNLKSSTVDDLDAISTRVLFLLGQDQTSDVARQAILAEGPAVSYQRAREIIEQHRQQAKEPPEPLTYASLCSGIEGASVAWAELGWRPLWFAEIDPFASLILDRHYRGVPNLKDMTRPGLEAEIHEAEERAWMSSYQAPRASRSASPVFGLAWMIRVASLPCDSLRSLLPASPPGSSGKTSPVSCQRTKDGAWVPSSGGWQNMGMGSPTECWTLSGSEFPSDAVGSSLWDMIAAIGPPPQRYSLSARQRSKMAARHLDYAKREVTHPLRKMFALTSGDGVEMPPPSSVTTSSPPSGPDREERESGSAVPPSIGPGD